MDMIREGWFSEISEMFPGQCLSLQVRKILHHEKSHIQDILVFESTDYGNVLVLDGAIQCTERDEFAYLEMIANLPVNSHPDPRSVLIIGGGGGGVVRELVKHPSVEKITMCEIDEAVVEASKKFFPTMSCEINNPKLNLVIGDGFDFISKHQNEYDVIIIDCSDPVGPSMPLFGKSFYKMLKDALKPEGVIAAQGEFLWLNLDLIKNMQNFCRELYPVVDYSYCTTPTFPSGQIGLLLCSLNPVRHSLYMSIFNQMLEDTNFREPLVVLSDEEVERRNLKYYSSDIHRASFALPQFAKQALNDLGKQSNNSQKK